MAQPSTIHGDIVFADTITFAEAPELPDESISADNIEFGADIPTTKLVHRYRAVAFQAGTAADATIPLFSARSVNGCTIVAVRVWSVTANVGNSTVTVDIKINGTTILSGVVMLDSSVAAYTPTAGTVSDDDGVTDDCYTAVIDATIGTGTLATGLCIEVEYDEEYV